MCHTDPSMTASPLRRVASWLGVGLVTLALIEVSTCAAVETGLLAGRRPGYFGAHYWQGDHPIFGVWRYSDAEYDHRSACFHVEYHTNSVGARDRERSLHSEQPRAVVLGDSFLEGWGLPVEARLSDRLEAATGREHLNFAMSHFSPYQAYLVYRDLASRYDHDTVILGVLPENDFVDLDLDLAREQVDYEYRYRPYLVGDAPPYHHLDYREPALRHALRNLSYAFNAYLVAEVHAKARAMAPRRQALPAATRRAPSWFYDYDEAQVRRLEEVLSMLAREARGKRVIVLLLPTLGDLQRYALSGPDPLSERLEPAARREGIQLVDLLPFFAHYTPEWRRYYLPCDYHWSAFGNEVATRGVLAALGPGFYGLGARGIMGE
jgi:SGNH hydrolase-like domain, acetyltransferase AlgX